ncbi:unnamed protein product [Adineta ricciae]|uniref:Nuclear receptor domain-containing protein n=1 Tax=Adineta ricciae TaxID=249248 RepID=A0A814N4V9_ADIRI|nr:unnamed protein product [Adineta ricciae]CAF1087372.1 unnamed protein product [Adineta ricciae]
MTENSLRQRKRILRRIHNNHRNKGQPAVTDPCETTSERHSATCSTHSRRKTEALICSICDGHAHGYNFDAITCESCKAFFRRNALKADGIPKCRLSNGKCAITVSTRKRCKACRLAKCFEKGMRADWILTDEERMSKRQKIEENRRLRQMLYPDSPESVEKSLLQTKMEPFDYDDADVEEEENDLNNDHITKALLLSSKDWAKIQQIQQAYADSIRLTSLSPEFPLYPQILPLNEVSDVFNFLTNLLATRLITFLKLLPEFSMLNSHDKFILTKYNTFTLTFIRAALNYNSTRDIYHEPHTDECIFNGRDIIQCFNQHQYNLSRTCLENFLKTSFNDRLILQLLLLVLIFSKGSSICAQSDEVEPIADDILTIYHTQNIFVDLLWKYCEQNFGERLTVKILFNLTVHFMDANVQAFNSRHGNFKTTRIADQLSPLIKSVLLIGEK